MSPLPPYKFPKHPSPRLKVVQDYFRCLIEFDLDHLRTLTTDDFTQDVKPASLDVPTKTKEEDIESLEQLRDSLKGKHLEYTYYDVNEGPGKIWVHALLETMDLEVIYLFQFGEGRYENKVIHVTDFSDSKRYIEIGA